MTGAELGLVAGLYLVTIASPGPATLAIAATAMERGRAAGLALACGVLTGSAAWGLAAALGFGALMQANAWALEAMRWAGGAYLLFLAFKSARAAIRGGAAPTGRAAAGGLKRLYLRGLGIHLTNPKAILFWASLFALGVPPGEGAGAVATLLAMCFAMAAAVFGGYALLFSTPAAMRAWARMARALNAGMAAIFGAAGAGLLVSRIGGTP